MKRLIFALWLVSFSLNVSAEETKKLLLLGQKPDGHKPSTHEYMPGVQLMAKLLADVPGLEVQVVQADDPWTNGPELLGKADGVFTFVSEGARWIHDDPRRRDAFAKLAQRGGGFVTLHWAMGTRDAKNIEGYLKMFGGCHGGPDRKYTVVEKAHVTIADKKHPVTTAIDDFAIREEFYYRLKFIKGKQKIHPILQTKIEGNVETVAWSWERPNGGRSFGFSGGHFHQNWQREEYRRMMAQAALWTLKLPVPEKGFDVRVSEKDLSLKP